MANDVNLELRVKVYNINFKENLPILQKCIALLAYSKFTEYVILGESKGIEDSIGYALDRCISENLLVDYFERLKRENRGMIFGSYSFKDHLKVAREEAFEDGAEAKARENARNLLCMNLGTPEQISQAVSLPLEEVLALKESLSRETAPAQA